MIRYHLVTQKQGHDYIFTCPQFPNVTGKGKTQYQAFAAMVTAIEKETQQLMTSGRPIPIRMTKQQQASRKRGTGSFGVPISNCLTILLHNAMLKKKISCQQLARLIAKQGNNHRNVKKPLDAIERRIKRLLSLSTPVSIQDMDHALRALNCNLSIQVDENRKLRGRLF